MKDRSSRTSLMEKLKTSLLISKSARINGPAFRNTEDVVVERKRQLDFHSGTIHPFSLFRWNWDILMTIVLVTASIMNPLQLAFYSEQDDQNVAVIIISTIISFIFFVDILLNMRTGVLDPLLVNPVVLERRIIRRKYATSWLAIDILSSIPYDTLYYILNFQIFTSTSNFHTYFKVIRLLSLLRIFRLFRVVQCLYRFEIAYKIPELHMRLINLLVKIFTILHWLACWHWMITDIFNPPSNRKKKSWISEAELWGEPVWFCYLYSALRALSNMGCLGYGGLGNAPREAEDIIATMVSIMIGATCFALYIASMGQIVQSVNVASKKFDGVILEVKDYLKYRHVPDELQGRVITYFEQRYRRHYFDEDMILNCLSDVLKTDLMVFNCKELIENVSLFKDLPSSFIKEILVKMTLQIYLPNDLIIECDSARSALHFIKEGQVEITTGSGNCVTTLHSGDYFGDESLVFENQKTTADVRAINYCDIYRLTNEDLFAVLEGYPEALSHIKSAATQRRTEIERRTRALPSQVDIE